MNINKLKMMCELGIEVHKEIEAKVEKEEKVKITEKELIKIKERIEYRMKIAEKEDKEFYEGFKISGLVEDVRTDLEEENLKPTIQNIDCAFDGFWY